VTALIVPRPISRYRDHAVRGGEAEHAEDFHRFILKERKKCGGGGTGIGHHAAVNRDRHALRVFGDGVTDGQFTKSDRYWRHVSGPSETEAVL
jgi:hypothetical protein